MKFIYKMVTCASLAAYLLPMKDVNGLSIYEQAMLELQQQQDEEESSGSNENSQQDEQTNVQTAPISEAQSEANLKNQQMVNQQDQEEHDEQEQMEADAGKVDNTIIQLEDVSLTQEKKITAPPKYVESRITDLQKKIRQQNLDKYDQTGDEMVKKTLEIVDGLSSLTKKPTATPAIQKAQVKAKDVHDDIITSSVIKGQDLQKALDKKEKQLEMKKHIPYNVDYFPKEGYVDKETAAESRTLVKQEAKKDDKGLKFAKDNKQSVPVSKSKSTISTDSKMDDKVVKVTKGGLETVPSSKSKTSINTDSKQEKVLEMKEKIEENLDKKEKKHEKSRLPMNDFVPPTKSKSLTKSDSKSIKKEDPILKVTSKSVHSEDPPVVHTKEAGTDVRNPETHKNIKDEHHEQKLENHVKEAIKEEITGKINKKVEDRIPKTLAKAPKKWTSDPEVEVKAPKVEVNDPKVEAKHEEKLEKHIKQVIKEEINKKIQEKVDEVHEDKTPKFEAESPFKRQVAPRDINPHDKIFEKREDPNEKRRGFPAWHQQEKGHIDAKKINVAPIVEPSMKILSKKADIVKQIIKAEAPKVELTKKPEPMVAVPLSTLKNIQKELTKKTLEVEAQKATPIFAPIPKGAELKVMQGKKPELVISIPKELKKKPVEITAPVKQATLVHKNLEKKAEAVVKALAKKLDTKPVTAVIPQPDMKVLMKKPAQSSIAANIAREPFKKAEDIVAQKLKEEIKVKDYSLEKKPVHILKSDVIDKLSAVSISKPALFKEAAKQEKMEQEQKAMKALEKMSKVVKNIEKSSKSVQKPDLVIQRPKSLNKMPLDIKQVAPKKEEPKAKQSEVISKAQSQSPRLPSKDVSVEKSSTPKSQSEPTPEPLKNPLITPSHKNWSTQKLQGMSKSFDKQIDSLNKEAAKVEIKKVTPTISTHTVKELSKKTITPPAQEVHHLSHSDEKLKQANKELKDINQLKNKIDTVKSTEKKHNEDAEVLKELNKKTQAIEDERNKLAHKNKSRVEALDKKVSHMKEVSKSQHAAENIINKIEPSPPKDLNKKPAPPVQEVHHLSHADEQSKQAHKELKEINQLKSKIDTVKSTEKKHNDDAEVLKELNKKTQAIEDERNKLAHKNKSRVEALDKKVSHMKEVSKSQHATENMTKKSEPVVSQPKQVLKQLVKKVEQKPVVQKEETQELKINHQSHASPDSQKMTDQLKKIKALHKELSKIKDDSVILHPKEKELVKKTAVKPEQPVIKPAAMPVPPKPTQEAHHLSHGKPNTDLKKINELKKDVKSMKDIQNKHTEELNKQEMAKQGKRATHLPDFPEEISLKREASQPLPVIVPRKPEEKIQKAQDALKELMKKVEKPQAKQAEVPTHPSHVEEEAQHAHQDLDKVQTLAKKVGQVKNLQKDLDKQSKIQNELSNLKTLQHVEEEALHAHQDLDKVKTLAKKVGQVKNLQKKLDTQPVAKKVIKLEPKILKLNNSKQTVVPAPSNQQTQMKTGAKPLVKAPVIYQKPANEKKQMDIDVNFDKQEKYTGFTLDREGEKEMDSKVINNGKHLIDEEDQKELDKLRLPTIGEKFVGKQQLHKVAHDINNHSSLLGSGKKEEESIQKPHIISSIEKLTKFSKKISGRDKKPSVLESIQKIHEMAKDTKEHPEKAAEEKKKQDEKKKEEYVKECKEEQKDKKDAKKDDGEHTSIKTEADKVYKDDELEKATPQTIVDKVRNDSDLAPKFVKDKKKMIEKMKLEKQKAEEKKEKELMKDEQPEEDVSIKDVKKELKKEHKEEQRKAIQKQLEHNSDEIKKNQEIIKDYEEKMKKVDQKQDDQKKSNAQQSEELPKQVQLQKIQAPQTPARTQVKQQNMKKDNGPKTLQLSKGSVKEVATTKKELPSMTPLRKTPSVKLPPPAKKEDSTPPVSHNLMVDSENMKHPKKNLDASLLKIHNKKDIVIHAKKEKKSGEVLSQQDKEQIKVPQAMEPAALMDKKDKKSETLPVYTDMKKHWVPNEDGVQDDQYKDGPSLAKLKNPEHLQSFNAKNTTEITIIPETVTKAENIPGSSLTQISNKHDIYTYSTTSDKPYGDRIVELVNEFHDTAERANALNSGLEPTINKLSDQIKSTIENGSSTGGSAAGAGSGTSDSAPVDGETLVQVHESKKAPARNIRKGQKLNQMSSKTVEQASEPKINMNVFEKTPQSELEVVTLQIDQLAQIKTVAEKLKKLRDDRDSEKKVFDAEATKLTQIRQSINDSKEELKAMYQKAGISIPKTINFNNLVEKK